MPISKKTLTPIEVAQLCFDVGFVGWQVVRMGQIAYAESGRDAWVIGRNEHDPSLVTYLSLDLGLFGINQYWFQKTFPGRPLSELFDPKLNAREARRIFEVNGGVRDPIKGYNAWSSYKNQSTQYKVSLADAIAAARAVGAY